MDTATQALYCRRVKMGSPPVKTWGRLLEAAVIPERLRGVICLDLRLSGNAALVLIPA
jgi:hypothetical protein